MSDKALVAEKVWAPADARNGLLAASRAATWRVGRHECAVVCEPMIRVGRDGTRRRALRVDLPPGVDGGQVRITEADGTTVDHEVVEAPDGCLRVLVPYGPDERPLRLGLPDLGSETVDFVADVPREWTIHLVHHSHLDIGYTDPQPVIQAEQRAYLDSVLEWCRLTDDWPEEARFRWAVESLWNFEQWAELRPTADVEEFCDRVREGRIELTAMPYNLHTDTCSVDELHELLRGAREVRDRHGIDFTTAMQTDVPGTVVGLPEALAEVGVKYLSVAHNWAGRSMPHHNGGEDLPRLFRWRSPGGAEVLVWMTDSPHGLAYMEGPFLGFHDGYATVDRLLPSYLASTAANGYPYPPGVFGWHGEPVTNRQPYPYDILHIRTQGWIGDNAPARLAAAEIVREWNDTWDHPKLRMSTNADFFADAEQRVGDRLQTFTGDWGDWWVEGVGSAALPQSLVRQAQARVTDAQVVSRVGQVLGGDANDREADQSRASYAAISLFNEHTWGASNSWRYGDEGMDSGEQQWHWKVAHAHAATERTQEFLERSSSGLGHQLGRGEGALESVYAVNTTSWPQTTVVRFLLRESVVGLDRPFTVVDARTGAAVPHRWTHQTNLTHRQSGRWVEAVVEDVPGVGFVRLDVRSDTDSDGAAEATGDRDGLPGGADQDSDVRTLPDVPRDELLTLSNDHLTVVYDERRSCLASIVERASGRELVNTDAVVGFNAYVYDTYTSAGGFNHQSNKTETGPKQELLGSRSLARPSVVLERTDDDVEQRLVVEFTAEGIRRGRTTFRLRHGEPMLHVENRLWKSPTMTKESAFFAFPFAVDDDAVIRHEVSGGVTGDGLPHVPGAPQHMRAVRDWVSLDSTAGSIAWVTKDAPLVHPETIALPYAPFPDSVRPRERGTLYSWVHNNVWDTNFPVEQGFDASFHYAVGVSGDTGLEGTALAAAAASTVVHPPVPVLARATGAPPRDSGELVTVSDPRVRIVSVCAGNDDTVQVRLQSLVDEPLTVDVTVPGAAQVHSAVRTSYLGDRSGSVLVDGRGARLEVPALGVAAVEFGL